MSDYLLLTGATGLLGRYLLRDLLSAGVPIAAVVRASRRKSPERRIDEILYGWEQRDGIKLPRPKVLQGDICSDHLGLSTDDLNWVSEHCDSLMHNAASLSFIATNGRNGEPWTSNVGGTQKVLEVCEKTGIRDFHHVSTAYVCGLRKGTIYENELDVGQERGNDYERSKIEAEQMVRDADFLAPPTVYRPAIIIGDSETGFTTTFHGFYALLRLAHTLVNSDESAKAGSEPTRLTLTGDESKNLVPVDWVSAVMSHVFMNREHHGKTFHITPGQATTVRTLQEVLEESIDHRNTVFVGGDEPIENPTVIEQLFYEHLKTYASYWRDDPVFDTTNTREAAPHLPCPTIDTKLLLKLADWAIKHEFRYKDAPVPAAVDA